MVTFEGVDGSGKSTQARMLADRLGSEVGEEAVLLVREPGGTPAAERVREILVDGVVELEPMAELMLFEAARADLVRRVLAPAAERGDWVVCDRFTDSTLAYQGAARGLGVEGVEQLNEMATAGLRPELTFYLRIEPRASLARTGADHRFEREGVRFMEEVASGYEEIAAREPSRVAVLDATQAAEEIHRQVWERLGLHAGDESPGGA